MSKKSEKLRVSEYMLTTWQEELLLKVQLQITELSNPLVPYSPIQFPSPPHGSFPKSQSFFPSFFPISLKAFTVPHKQKPNNYKESMKFYLFVY